MAAGLAVLDVIDEEGIQHNARDRGRELKHGLARLQRSYPLIGDVRGMGLMLGVELVRDRGTKEPAKAAALEVLESAREQGLLIGKGGLDGNILRIKPPMCITALDVEFALDVLNNAFASAASS
jgi:alanine-glyoxylate transaminase/(R)-3-amino-2-methylpropionate-pyruvate transaminase